MSIGFIGSYNSLREISPLFVQKENKFCKKKGFYSRNAGLTIFKKSNNILQHINKGHKPYDHLSSCRNDIQFSSHYRLWNEIPLPQPDTRHLIKT